jgi:hypothetical protein
MRPAAKALISILAVALPATACSSGGGTSSTPTTRGTGGNATTSAPTSGASSTKVIATVATSQPGLVMELNDVRRGQGDVVTARFTIVNQGTQDGHAQFLLQPGSTRFEGSYLLDAVNHKKYLTLIDANKTCLCSQPTGSLKPGERASFFASFPAPPAAVSSVQVAIDGCPPIDNVPIAGS